LADTQSRGTILVVDDEVMLRQTVAGYLSDSEFEILTAENGKEAVEIFKANPNKIDLVITDIFMPVMSGFELISTLRGIDKDLPVIILTGSADVQNIEIEELSATVHSVFAKPLSDLAVLEYSVQKALEDHGRATKLREYKVLFSEDRQTLIDKIKKAERNDWHIYAYTQDARTVNDSDEGFYQVMYREFERE